MAMNLSVRTLGLWILLPGAVCGQQLQNLPGLQKIVITELTSSTNTLSLSPNDPKLLTRLTTLDSTTNDLSTTANELYDVFYSDMAGAPRTDGSCLSIECVAGTSNQAGFNIAQVDFQFQNGQTKSPNVVGSVVVGNSYVLNSENFAIDNSPTTFTSLGNTQTKPKDFRMRLTLCFCDLPCCQPGGGCCIATICVDDVSARDCRARQGQFLGAGKACDEGACRVNGQCAVLPRAKCLERGGDYAGTGTTC